MLRLALLSLLASASLSSALVVPKYFLDVDLDAVVAGGQGRHSSVLDVDLAATVGSTNGKRSKKSRPSSLLDVDLDAAVASSRSLVDLTADIALGSSSSSTSPSRSRKSRPSLFKLDLDATLLSAKKGLVDATATLKAGGTDVVGAIVKSGSKALIDLDVLASVLGPQQCTGNALIGVVAEVTVGKLLHVCACIEVLGLSNPLAKPCPACPSNSDPICGRGQCSCQCREGYFSDPTLGCLPIETCTSTSGTLRPRRDGSTSCACSSPFIRNPRTGGCTLPPSIRARCFARQLSQTPLSTSQCPGANERVCALNGGAKGAFECLDVGQALESCGACPGEEGSVNCLTEVEGAENVACVKGECVVSSCFPGYRYRKGRCVRLSARA